MALTGCKLVFIMLALNAALNSTLAFETPRLNITIRTDNKDEFEVGTPRVLACIVVGCASSLNITWYIGDIMLKPNVYKEVNRGNFTVSSLTFFPSLTDNGKELVCRATNGHLSQVFEDKVTISVGQRPKCVDSTYKTIRAVEGESQTLVCFVESDPDPDQFVWSFPGGRTIYTSSKTVPGHKSRYSSALVWVPQRDDYGPVSCRALNRFGDQKQPCTFSVVSVAPNTPDCDFHFESHEFNVPCGKKTTTETPKYKDVLDRHNPEDAPPVEVYESVPKYELYEVIVAATIGLTILSAILVLIVLLSHCCCDRLRLIVRGRNIPRANNINMQDLNNARHGGSPAEARNACKITSSCPRYEYPELKNEFCI